jgi:hypothetical protein
MVFAKHLHRRRKGYYDLSIEVLKILAMLAIISLSNAIQFLMRLFESNNAYALYFTILFVDIFTAFSLLILFTMLILFIVMNINS